MHVFASPTKAFLLRAMYAAARSQSDVCTPSSPRHSALAGTPGGQFNILNRYIYVVQMNTRMLIYFCHCYCCCCFCCSTTKYRIRGHSAGNNYSRINFKCRSQTIIEPKKQKNVITMIVSKIPKVLLRPDMSIMSVRRVQDRISVQQPNLLLIVPVVLLLYQTDDVGAGA